MATDYKRVQKAKACQFCAEDITYIDYKDEKTIRKYTTDRGKIKPRRVTGACAQHQHELAVAVKRAREMALAPYTVPVISGASGRRGR